MPLEEAAEAVRQQLSGIATGREKAQGLYGTGASEKPKSYAAIVFNSDSHSKLETPSAYSDGVQEGRTGHGVSNSDSSGVMAALSLLKDEGGAIGSFIQEHEEQILLKAQKGSLHVTLVHQRSEGAGRVAEYAALMGNTVEVRVVGLAYNEKCGALIVEWAGFKDGSGPLCATSKPHITVSPMLLSPAVTVKGTALSVLYCPVYSTQRSTPSWDSEGQEGKSGMSCAFGEPLRTLTATAPCLARCGYAIAARTVCFGRPF